MVQHNASKCSHLQANDKDHMGRSVNFVLGLGLLKCCHIKEATKEGGLCSLQVGQNQQTGTCAVLAVRPTRNDGRCL